MVQDDWNQGFITGFVAGLSTSHGGTEPEEYVQPADWIDITTCAAGNINLLVADIGLATYAFKCTTSGAAQYHVDWGDGNSDDVNSNSNAQHTYTVGTGQACSRGYTTFKIVISPVSGNLATFAVTNHSLSTNNQTLGILACVCGATALTHLNFAFYKSTVQCSFLEWFKTSGTLSSCSGATNMFQSCTALQSVDVSGLVAVTDASVMFAWCYSLRSVDISNMTEIDTTISMFNYCYDLRSIDISTLTALEIASSMFSQCYSLRSVNIGTIAAVTNASAMFKDCYVLENIDVSSLVAITNASYMFQNCYNLQEVTIGDMPSATNSSYMFASCHSLNTIDVTDMSAVTNASGMFQYCYSLVSADVDSMAVVANASSMFTYCYALTTLVSTNFASSAASLNGTTMFDGCEQLTSIDLSNAKVTKLDAKGTSGKLDKLATILFHASSTFSGSSPQFDLRYNTLTNTQLDTIFTALPTVTSKTINITGCTGEATCTKSIATAKGWTVTPP